jgi:SAM-dependent methyltransferase
VVNYSKKLYMMSENTSSSATILAPFNPTSESAIEASLHLLNLSPGDALVDLGCGDGRVLISALKREPKLYRCIGLEADAAVLEKAKKRVVEFENSLTEVTPITTTTLSSALESSTSNSLSASTLNIKHAQIELFGLDASSSDAATLLETIAKECEDLQKRDQQQQVSRNKDNSSHRKLAIFVYLVPNGLKVIQPFLHQLVVQHGARVVSNMFRAFGDTPPNGVRLSVTKSITTSSEATQGKQLTPLNVYLYERDEKQAPPTVGDVKKSASSLQQQQQQQQKQQPDPAFNEVTSSLGGIKLGGTKSTRLAYQYDGRIIYEWEQTLEEVLIFIKPPPGVKAAHMDISIAPKRLRIGLKGAPPFMDEDLGGVCVVSESIWTLEPPKRGLEGKESGELLITLTKAHRALTWESAFVGHGAMDTASKEAVQRAMLLERFGAENPGFDFSSAEINGNVPDPRVFMNGPGSKQE